MNRKINHIHERALRLVYDDYESSFQELLTKDNTVTIHHRNIQYVAIEMYKIIHNLCPPIMNELVVGQNNLSGRSNTSFIKPKVNTVYYGDNSFRNFGPRVWDEMLPKKYKSCRSLEEFKTSIKSWKPKDCPCRLCKQFISKLGFI